LNHDDQVKALLPEILHQAPELPELRKIAAVVELTSGNTEKALDHLSNIPIGSNSGIDLLRAEIFTHAKRYSEALTIYEKTQPPFPTNAHEFLAKGQRIRLIAKIEGYKHAIREMEKAEEKFGNEPILFAIIAKFYLDFDCRDIAINKAQNAAKLLNEQSLPLERFEVAEILFELELYLEGAAVYLSILRNYSHSHILRRYLICLFEADQRKSALEILEKLDERTRNIEFYRRISFYIYSKTGDMKNAYKEIEEYLILKPEDLGMRLNWIALNQRLDNNDAIRDYLSTAPSFLNSPIDEQVRMSHLFFQYGYPEIGLKLAYTLLKEHQNEPCTNLSYIHIMMLGGLPADIIHVSSIGVDSAFVLEGIHGERDTFIIEEISNNKHYHEVIPPKHPVAQQAMGKVVGEKINLIRPFQTISKTIVEVQSKYTLAYEQTLLGFEKKFPYNKNFLKIDIGTDSKGHIDPTPIHNAVDHRHSLVSKIEEYYITHAIPACSFAEFIGVHPFEAWIGLMQKEGSSVKCCHGSSQELKQALLLVDKAPPLIIDPLTLYSAVLLGVHNELSKTFGKIGIAQSSLDMFSSYAKQIRLYPPKSTLGKEGNIYKITEYSDSFIQNVITRHELIADWITANCHIIPAIGDLTHGLLKISAYLPPAFLDTILAAKETGMILLSDDLHLRDIAKTELGVEGIWLQVAMMTARQRQKITLYKYAIATAHLIEAGVHFTTIDAPVILELAKGCKWTPDDHIKHIFRYLGDNKIEDISAIKILLSITIAIWSQPTPSWNKQHFTYLILNALTARISYIPELCLSHLLQFYQEIPVNIRLVYLETLKKWCQGHFIPIPSIIKKICP